LCHQFFSRLGRDRYAGLTCRRLGGNTYQHAHLLV
jgi:hypothetical protein